MRQKGIGHLEQRFFIDLAGIQARGYAAIEILPTVAENQRIAILDAEDEGNFRGELGEATRLRGQALELVGLDDGHACALDSDPLVATKLVQ